MNVTPADEGRRLPELDDPMCVRGAAWILTGGHEGIRVNGQHLLTMRAIGEDYQRAAALLIREVDPQRAVPDRFEISTLKPAAWDEPNSVVWARTTTDRLNRVIAPSEDDRVSDAVDGGGDIIVATEGRLLIAVGTRSRADAMVLPEDVPPPSLCQHGGEPVARVCRWVGVRFSDAGFERSLYGPRVSGVPTRLRRTSGESPRTGRPRRSTRRLPDSSQSASKSGGDTADV